MAIDLRGQSDSHTKNVDLSAKTLANDVIAGVKAVSWWPVLQPDHDWPVDGLPVRSSCKHWWLTSWWALQWRRWSECSPSYAPTRLTSRAFSKRLSGAWAAVKFETSLLREFKLPQFENPNKYAWRIHLCKSEKYWVGWFEGPSKKFLNLKVANLLLLVDQMQGKF